MLREPVGDRHGEAEQPQADAVHLRSDGNVGKERPIPAHGSAAALKVFDNVEDLLALCLPHHPPSVQQSGNMLFPVGRRMDGGKGGMMSVNGHWMRVDKGVSEEQPHLGDSSISGKGRSFVPLFQEIIIHMRRMSNAVSKPPGILCRLAADQKKQPLILSMHTN